MSKEIKELKQIENTLYEIQDKTYRLHNELKKFEINAEYEFDQIRNNLGIILRDIETNIIENERRLK